MVERELVVGTLGEIDPIDDRLMQQKESQGGCLLGYNTNHGARIDLKLRTDDLQGFLPYHQIAATLVHELSHNWVGEHNALFWTNYAQMRVEYLHKHASLAAAGYVVNGRTSADHAGVVGVGSSSLPLSYADRGGDADVDGSVSMRQISVTVISECKSEMIMYGIPVEIITPAVLDRCQEIKVKGKQSVKNPHTLIDTNVHAIGSNTRPGTTAGHLPTEQTARELALAAAERRLREKDIDKDMNSNGKPI